MLKKQKILESLETLFNKIEHSLDVRSKIAIGLTVGLLSIWGLSTLFSSNDVTMSSVKIVNFSEQSGGTGVILESSSTESLILTNSHVCSVIEKGGLVLGLKGEAMVDSYKHSKVHDLCLVKVRGNMGSSTKVASRSPVSYYEKAVVSGHPALLPNVVTSGHFSGKMVIDVLIGFKPCTEEQFKDPYLGPYCFFFNGLPIIKRFESTLVTATIMAGSSGSGVYNEDNELSGLVFAGSGELSYAWTVPYEAMRYFLDIESKEMDYVSIDTVRSIEKENKSKAMWGHAEKKCLKETIPSPEIAKICSLLKKDILWRN